MPPGTRILIVDDEEIFAENLWEYCRKRLAEVKVVPSGEAALEVAHDFKPDVLILDYGLPGMDGLETFARLKSLPLRYGCVLVTGTASQHVCQAALATGICHVLEKPCAFSELVALISRRAGQPAAGTHPDRRNVERRRSEATAQGWPDAAASAMRSERRKHERRNTQDRRHSGRR